MPAIHEGGFSVVSLPGSSRLWGLSLELPRFLTSLNLLRNCQATQASWYKDKALPRIFIILLIALFSIRVKKLLDLVTICVNFTFCVYVRFYVRCYILRRDTG